MKAAMVYEELESVIAARVTVGPIRIAAMVADSAIERTSMTLQGMHSGSFAWESPMVVVPWDNRRIVAISDSNTIRRAVKRTLLFATLMVLE